MTTLALRNILAYSGQIAILIGVAAALAALLKLTPKARLHCLQLLLACCLILPFAQPWHVPAAATDAVTVVTIPISYGPHTPIAPQYWNLPWGEMVLGILAAGVMIRFALIALGMLRLGRYLERARFVPTAFPVERRRTRTCPDVFISNEIKGPATFGLFRPVVLVPERWIDNETIAYHELLHVRRRDWAFSIVEEFVRALLWFHPAIWWLIGRIQLTREEVVDREAVRLMESREHYLDTLLAIAAARAGLDLAPAPLFLKRRHLRQRVAALLKEVTMSKARVRSSLASLVAVLAVAGWMAVRSFPLQAAPQDVKDAAGVSIQHDATKLLHRAPVRYPADAAHKGIQGTVLVEATLDQNGEVTDAQIISGPQELRRAALESVLQWHYNKELGLPPKVQVAIDFVLPAVVTGPGITTRPGVIRMAPPPPPPPPPPSTSTVQSIELGSLPAGLREKVAARLPVHVGDQLTGQGTADIVNTLNEIDGHLRMGIKLSSDGKGSVVNVSLNDSTLASTPSRIRVGDNVIAANLIYKVQPVYPQLAKQARVQGTVRFTAIIGKDGHILNLQLISGHPLLVQPAQDAVKQWIYKPTLLNGEPVEVVTQIDVSFTLSDEPPAQPLPPGSGKSVR
jgi:protein TonB